MSKNTTAVTVIGEGKSKLEIIKPPLTKNETIMAMATAIHEEQQAKWNEAFKKIENIKRSIAEELARAVSCGEISLELSKVDNGVSLVGTVAGSRAAAAVMCSTYGSNEIRLEISIDPLKSSKLGKLSEEHKLLCESTRSLRVDSVEVITARLRKAAKSGEPSRVAEVLTDPEIKQAFANAGKKLLSKAEAKANKSYSITI